MSLFQPILKLFLIFVIYSSVVTGSPQERKLLNDLLVNYNVLERPVDKPENPVTVYLAVTLMHIDGLDAKTGVLRTNFWLTTEWNDFNLKWNPQTYGNISTLRIAPNRVWRPDILIYNSPKLMSWQTNLSLESWKYCTHEACYGNHFVDPKFDPTFQTNVAVKQDGNVTVISPGIFSTSCKMDLTYFPFDEQKCSIKFGSWSHDGLELNLKLQEGGEVGADLSSYISNSEWDIIGMPVQRNEIYYACCPEPYVDISFNLKVRRRGDLHFSQAQLFNALIGITLMLSFLTPLNSGHKITLGISSLLMNSWILSAVQAQIPPQSNSILVFYFSCLFLISFVGLMANVITLYLFHTTVSMPDWAKVSLVDSIPESFLKFICPLKKVTKPARDTSLVESGTGENGDVIENPQTEAAPWRYAANILDRCFFVLFALILLIFHGVFFPSIDSMTSRGS